MLTNIQFKRNIFALLTKKVTQFSFLSILFDGCLKALCKLGFFYQYMLYLVSFGWYFRMDNNRWGFWSQPFYNFSKKNVKKKNSHKFVKKKNCFEYFTSFFCFSFSRGHVVSGIDLFLNLTLTVAFTGLSTFNRIFNMC